MYSIKVQEGRERISVRNYASGFLPSYTSAAENSMGKRLFVVPGYIFSMKRSGNAEKVPEADWKVIEAIADPHLSVLDIKRRQIVDGPLKGLLIYRINPALKSVCIRAKLLGMTRDYWLAVRFEADAAEEAGNATGIETEKRKEKGMANDKNYTDEQLKEAIARAKEIGIHAAGKETGIPWQAIMSAAKKSGVEIQPRQINKTQEARKLRKAAAAEGKKTETAESSVNAEKIRGRKAEMPEKEIRKEVSSLEIENAMLKAENEKLKEKVAKLTKALQELL